MNLEVLGAAIGQVLVLGAFFFWLSRRNTERIDQIRIDIAVMKNDMKHVRADHDLIIKLQGALHKAETDIHAAHEKIRALN